MTKNLKWPDEMPVLTGGDICRNASHKGQNSCLMGWLARSFDAPDVLEATYHPNRCGIPRRSVVLLSDVCREETGHKDPMHCNDDPSIPKSCIAKIWNRFIAKAGYTEGNPES